MFSTCRVRHGVHFYKVWFAKEPFKKSGIIAYYQASFKDSRVQVNNYDTIVNDLTPAPEEIKAQFSKSCKYKVNRAAREDVQLIIKDSKDITDEDIDEFLKFFKEFWESKDVEFNNSTSVRQDLVEYRAGNNLTLAYAVVCGEKAIYHTYVYDDTTARLLHSASLYRLQGDAEGTNKNLIGMANRYMHYEEMLHFKQMGKSVYDWGGAGRGEDVINITEFKESFGGELKQDYNFEVTNGIVARLFRIVARLCKKS